MILRNHEGQPSLFAGGWEKWDNQVRSQLACLHFMMQLQKVVGHAH